MENLFADDSSSDESHNPLKGEFLFPPPIPELKLEPAVAPKEEPNPDEDGIDLYGRWALLDVAESSKSVLLPTILPEPENSQPTERSTMEFFNTPGTQFMYIQMPNAMPHLDKERTLHERGSCFRNKAATAAADPQSKKGLSEGPNDPSIYQTSKVGCLPSGKLGKMRIHKSGKIKLHVGNHVFNFMAGNTVSCKQQVGCFLPENNEFLFLGNYRKKFVAFLDLGDLRPQQKPR